MTSCLLQFVYAPARKMEGLQRESSPIVAMNARIFFSSELPSKFIASRNWFCLFSAKETSSALCSGTLPLHAAGNVGDFHSLGLQLIPDAVRLGEVFRLLGIGPGPDQGFHLGILPAVLARSCPMDPAAPGALEISHCREGRMEYRLGDRYFYLAPGDLSVARQDVLPTAATFPTGHYHGVTVTVDPGQAPRCLSCFLEDVEVQPAALAEKFCAAGGYFAARSSRRVEHVFSELYHVPEDLRQGYLKVKVLELLLFLSALEVAPVPQAVPGLTRGQVSLAKKTADYLLANTESKVTTQELSRHFGASAAQIRASFQGVYGRSPAAWLRLQKMHGAAELLRSTDRTVLDIAGQFGYDNASKFARAFRDVIGVSPNEYRSGVEQDSCAPV